jgi:predicted ABC-type ATPase
LDGINLEINKGEIYGFIGPNGSGKTTVSQGLPVFGTYINADDLKMEYGLTDLEAAQQAELLRNTLLDKRVDFSFETVLSTKRNLVLLKKAKNQGYEVRCIYVLTCNENINVVRVKARHAASGHNVPEDKIRKRYHKALALIPQLLTVCDKMLIYDNSNMPTLILHKENRNITIFPNDLWSEADLRKLSGHSNLS